MKPSFYNIIKYSAITTLIILVIIIVIPLDLFNIEQAERIAKWKTTYEKLKYSFSLVALHENSIVPTNIEARVLVDENYIISRISPYLNLKTKKETSLSKYNYKKMNGKKIPKTSQYYFDKFLQRKDGTILGIKKNFNKPENDKIPSYIMLVDINGTQKPNRIGKDIFFISIYKNHITALGNEMPHSQLKASCSAIGGGFYCSEYYLLGGKF